MLRPTRLVLVARVVCGFCGMQLVIVFYIYAQARLQRRFCVARRKLFFVMIQKEIQGIVGVHVDEDQIRIGHEQLAEAQTIAPEGHVIT